MRFVRFRVSRVLVGAMSHCDAWIFEILVLIMFKVLYLFFVTFRIRWCFHWCDVALQYVIACKSCFNKFFWFSKCVSLDFGFFATQLVRCRIAMPECFTFLFWWFLRSSICISFRFGLFCVFVGAMSHWNAWLLVNLDLALFFFFLWFARCIPLDFGFFET